jgi:hypothetical protein
MLFVWTQDHELAFSTLKQALSSAPVLALPDFSKTFCVETDACNNGVGAVLLQDGHPLAYISKPLGPKTLKAFLPMKRSTLLSSLLMINGNLICCMVSL